MKRLLTTLLACAAMPLLAADTLHVYTWADYLNPDLVSRFEKENKCKVVIDTFDSNEAMFARLKAGAKGYDIIFPSSYIIALMASEGLIQPIDHSKLPNLKNLDPAILQKVPDKEMKHSVPYTIGYSVIAYSKSRLKNPEATWRLFERADIKKKATLLDDARETLGMGLRALGYDVNTRDEKQIGEARDFLKKIKPNLAKFDNEGYKSGLDSGEFIIAHGYSGDLWQVMQENEDIGMLLPKEGFAGACDEMVITKSAAQPGLALKLINFLLDAEVAAENMEWLGYVCPNLPALEKVSDDFKKNPIVNIPAELRDKVQLIDDVGVDLPKFTKAWDDLKSSK